MIPRDVFFDWLLIAALAILVGLAHGWAGIPDVDSKVYITIARNMIDSNNWLIPIYYNQPFYLHPPLGMWLIALSFKIFGFSIYAARIPMVLTLFGTLLLMYVLAFWLRNRVAALFSCFIFCISYPVIQITPKVHLDLPLTFFIMLAITGIFFAIKLSKRWYLITGIGTGLALLTKGIVGFAPFPILGLTLLFNKRLKDIFSPYLWVAVIISFLIPFAWLYGIHSEGIRWITSYWTSGIQMVSNIDFEGIKRGYLYIPLIFLIHFLPWSPFSIMQVVSSLRTKNEDRIWIIFLSTILVFLIAFSLPSYKLPHYILPSLPAASILSSIGITSLMSARVNESLRFVIVAFIGIISITLAIYPNPVRKERSEDIIPLFPIIEAIHKEKGLSDLAIININPSHHMPYWERVAAMELYIGLPIEIIFKTKEEEVKEYFKEEKYALIENSNYGEISKIIPNLRILSRGSGQLLLVSNSQDPLPTIHYKFRDYGNLR